MGILIFCRCFLSNSPRSPPSLGSVSTPLPRSRPNPSRLSPGLYISDSFVSYRLETSSCIRSNICCKTYGSTGRGRRVSGTVLCKLDRRFCLEMYPSKRRTTRRFFLFSASCSSCCCCCAPSSLLLPLLHRVLFCLVALCFCRVNTF